MRKLLGHGALLLVVLLGWRLVTVQTELDSVESSSHTRSLAFQRDVAGIQAELSSIRVTLEAAHEKAGVAEALSDRLRSAESRIGTIGETIDAQASSLSDLERERESFGPDVLEQELDARDQRLLTRWESLTNLVSSAKEAADESKRQVLELSEQRDLRRMWRELVGPVVQLAGETSVGSGVLLSSVEDAAAGSFRTYLVTAWHVVRDIQGDLSKTDMPVPVNIYGEDGSIRHEESNLLCFDPELDVALLELETPEALEHGAQLASVERLGEVRIFDGIYAVGCPLGNDPIPTYGEVATVQHEVDDEVYWMINAPTYIGNSGGGIFDSDTRELLGIFSKIYTHGTLRPTIVPHMGLVTPMSKIYTWAKEEGYDLQAHAAGPTFASADK